MTAIGNRHPGVRPRWRSAGFRTTKADFDLPERIQWLRIARMKLAIDPHFTALIALACQEDLGAGDCTTKLLAQVHHDVSFQLLAKQAGVFAGIDVAAPVLHAYDTTIEMNWTPGVADGVSIRSAPSELGVLRGSLPSLLAAERVFLNFLQRLCGVATLTRRFVDAVAGTGAAICDTRKTIPGWRTLDKYAVRCGGGVNHRTGLYDAVLIKDNHLAGVKPGGVAAAVFHMLNRLDPTATRPAFIEVEAQTIEQVEELLTVVGLDLILLDNFSLEGLREAVALREAVGLRGKIEFEASGGITLENVRQVAETGVERISVGALTHSAPALDLSLERV